MEDSWRVLEDAGTTSIFGAANVHKTCSGLFGITSSAFVKVLG